MNPENKNKINAINLDLFGKKITLFFNGNETDGTIFGKIMTFIYVLIYVISFLMFTLAVFLKKVKTYYDSEITSKELPKISLNHDLLYFGFSLQDSETYDSYIDETIYYPKAYYKKAKRKNKIWQWEIEEIEIEKCKIEKFGKKYQNLFSNKPLDNLYCIKNINQTLKGHYIYDEYSLYSISIFPCINTTENNNSCKSIEEIKNKIDHSFFSVELESVGLSPTNLSYPAQPIIENLYTTIGSGFGRKFHVFLELVEIHTDQNFIYETVKKEKYLQYYKNIPMINVKTNNLNGESSLCDFELKLSDKIKFQKRSCMKMYTAFSNMGGVMIVIRAIIILISFLPIESLHELKIINKLFKIDKSKRELFLNNLKQIKIMNLKYNINSSFEDKNLSQSEVFQVPMSRRINTNQGINFSPSLNSKSNNTKNEGQKSIKNYSRFYKKEMQSNEEKENEAPSSDYIANKDNINCGNNKSNLLLISEINENMMKQYNNISEINENNMDKKENNQNDQNISKDPLNKSLRIDNLINFSLRKETSDKNMNFFFNQNNNNIDNNNIDNNNNNLFYTFKSRFSSNIIKNDNKLKLNCLETYFVRLCNEKMKSKNILLFQEITNYYRKYLDVIKIFRNQIVFDRIIEKDINNKNGQKTEIRNEKWIKKIFSMKGPKNEI